jgi:hypothetical protein
MKLQAGRKIELMNMTVSGEFWCGGQVKWKGTQCLLITPLQSSSIVHGTIITINDYDDDSKQKSVRDHTKLFHYPRKREI